MTTLHNLGFPRIGARRQLKFALEKYWRKDISLEQLLQTSDAIRAANWQTQATLNWITVNDFSLYDHILDHSLLLDAVPRRFGDLSSLHHADRAFCIARGRDAVGRPVAAAEMTKWFNTNYHYIVPELRQGQQFGIASEKLFEEVVAAQTAGHDNIKPVLPGPLTWLWLAKAEDDDFDKLSLLDNLLHAYSEILSRLAAQGVQWVQLDEPILALDLPSAWKQAFERGYHRLQTAPVKLLLASYFGPLADNLHLATHLPVDGLHIDAISSEGELEIAADQLAHYKVMSAGIIDGRNVWRANLLPLSRRLQALKERLGERLWLAPSCSLLHVPVDLKQETLLDAKLKNWLSFAVQKLEELKLLGKALDADPASCVELLRSASEAAEKRRTTSLINNPQVQQRLQGINSIRSQRTSHYNSRRSKQIDLPILPTTTIGSFPQTASIRQARKDWREQLIDTDQYRNIMRQQIRRAVERQLDIGLDVLVHGEPERNDMVEYFGEQLEGFAFTRYGWVQSYGSRCVKPPILFGDVSRPRPMTLEWIGYAQSLTTKPVKGMLTGPVTLLNWSFVRDDQPREQTCRQLALALRDEVLDLEAAGIRVIQIDEAALREGLPLRRKDWQHYLDWATECFRITANGVSDTTQIHTHMCYSEFNDIIKAVAAMDADVISIETARSRMELLDAFAHFEYPTEIGPGVYDIHSPNIPSVDSILALLEQALQRIPAERLWVNPDCGLKTRDWPEVEAALRNMVTAAKSMRQHLQHAKHQAKECVQI